MPNTLDRLDYHGMYLSFAVAGEIELASRLFGRVEEKAGSSSCVDDKPLGGHSNSKMDSALGFSAQTC